MAVIDIRDNPAVDIANARAIGDIFSAIGRAETLRKQKRDMDTLMTSYTEGRQNGVENPFEYAVQKTRESAPATYDTGLKGMWQKLGNAASLGRRVDVTKDVTERMLMAGLHRELQMQDPMYQAQLDATKTNTAGDKQTQEITAKIAPSQISQAESQAKVAEVKAAAAPTEIEQNLEAGALRNKALEMEVQNMPERDRLDIEAKRNQIANEKTRMGWAAEDVEMKKELFARERMLEARKLKKDIDNDEYEAEMKLLEIKGKKLDNKYLKAQTDYISSTVGKPSEATMRGVYAAIAEGTVNETNEIRYRDLVEADGYRLEKVKLPDYLGSDGKMYPGGFDYRVISALPGVANPGSPNPGNPGDSPEQSEFSGVSTDDLLKGLMGAY